MSFWAQDSTKLTGIGLGLILDRAVVPHEVWTCNEFLRVFEIE